MSQFIEMFGKEQKVSLGKICLIQKGATITRNEVTIGSIPVVAGGQEPSCYHNEANRNADMITISASGAYAGYVNYWVIPIFASDCNTIFPKDTKQLDISFLYNGLKAMQKEIYSLQKGGAQPHVYGKDLHNLLFPFPPFERQQEFSDIVKQADKSKFIGFKSQFIEMFSGFGTDKLSNIAKITMGTSPDSKFYNTNGLGLPFYQGKTEFGEMYINEALSFCSEPIRQAEADDVLMSVRAPVGTVNIATAKCCIGRGLAAIQAKEDITTPLFLYHALTIIEDSIAKLGTGSTFKAINKDVVYSIQIPKVDISVQLKFVEIAQQADKSKYIN